MAKGPGDGGVKPPKDPTIYGTAGNDKISLALNADHGDMVDGLAGNDTIIGSSFQDFLYGNDGDDNVFGGAGDDWIEGGLGNDYLNGGAGASDWVTFGRAANGVTVDLAITIAQNTGVGLDRIVNFENLAGSNFNDTLRGNAGSNWISDVSGNDLIDGRAGNDFIQDYSGNDRIFGGDGNDTIADMGLATDVNVIDGGLGNDTLDFQASFRPAPGPGVTLDLNVLTAQNTAHGIYTVSGIENVFGTNAGADFITGNALDNVIEGRGGADVIKGMGGNDRIVSNGVADGGAGNDDVWAEQSAFGGDGNDKVVGWYAVADGGNGDDNVMSFATSIGGAGNDKVAGFTMTGGLGIDHFSTAGSNYVTNNVTLNTQLESTVLDFNRAQGDKIDLAASFAAIGITGFFVGNAEFTSFVGHAEARIVAGATVQNVEIDFTGDRVADIIMHVNGSTPLIASDFLLI